LKLSRTALDILNEINHKTRNGTFITLDGLEVTFGLSGSELRPFLEDLKEEILIVEHTEGFQVSDNGRHFSNTRWA